MLLKMRSGIDIPKDAMICLHHEKIFLEKYEHFQKNCIDPYGCHKKLIKKSLYTVDIDMAFHIKDMGFESVKPGMKLCSRCYQGIIQAMEPFDIVTSDNSQTDPWFQPADDRQQSLFEKS